MSETADVRQVIERLRRFAERVYADKADLWPTPERPYVDGLPLRGVYDDHG